MLDVAKRRLRFWDGFGMVENFLGSIAHVSVTFTREDAIRPPQTFTSDQRVGWLSCSRAICSKVTDNSFEGKLFSQCI